MNQPHQCPEIKESFYKITEPVGRGAYYKEYYTYIRWPCPLPLDMVVDIAIETGDMLECNRHCVSNVEEITREEYFTHMWE